MAHAHQAHATGWIGWIAAAAILIGIAGVMHIIFGFAAVLSQPWYITTESTVYLFDAAQWGWMLIAGGVLMMISATLLAVGNMAGRILGGIIVAGSLVANFSLFAAAPIWATLAIVVDLVILYAIIAHGGEMKRLDDEVV